MEEGQDRAPLPPDPFAADTGGPATVPELGARLERQARFLAAARAELARRDARLIELEASFAQACEMADTFKAALDEANARIQALEA